METYTYDASSFNVLAFDASSNLSSLDNYTSGQPTPEPEGLYSEHFLNLVSVVVPVFFGLIAVLGFFGNLLVIIVVVSNKQMRSTTNILIVSLAIADFIFIVICVPFTAVRFATGIWPFGSVFCKAYQYLMHVTAHASVYTLVLMSADRYLAVVHPISSMVLRTERNANVAIGLSWLVICGCNVPMLWDFEVFSHDGDTYDCVDAKAVEDPSRYKVFYGCFFVFAFVLPLAIVCVLYGLMIRRLLGFGCCCGGGGGKQTRLTSARSSDAMRSKRRVTKMVVIVVVTFAACWLPLQVIFMVTVFGSYPSTDGWTAVKLAANCLAYVNSCVNPFLYAFLSDNFRKSFRKFLGCFGGFQALRKSEMERTSVRDAADTTKQRSNVTKRSSCL